MVDFYTVVVTQFCCCTLLLGCYIIWKRSAIPGQRPETWLSSDCCDTSELQGVDASYLQLWVRFLRVVWQEHRVLVHARVSTFLMCVCVPSPVCLCSLSLISVKELGHDVFKGTCSNYGQLCSLNALPHCTLLLHQPDIPTKLQYTFSLAASSVDLQIHSPVLSTQSFGCVFSILWPWHTKQRFWQPHIFHLACYCPLQTCFKDLVWKRLNESQKHFLRADLWLMVLRAFVPYLKWDCTSFRDSVL